MKERRTAGTLNWDYGSYTNLSQQLSEYRPTSQHKFKACGGRIATPKR